MTLASSFYWPSEAGFLSTEAFPFGPRRTRGVATRGGVTGSTGVSVLGAVRWRTSRRRLSIRSNSACTSVSGVSPTSGQSGANSEPTIELPICAARKNVLSTAAAASPTAGVATNVPGAQVPMYLAGHRMLDFVGLVPLAGTLGYGVAIVSYNQGLFFGLIAEPRMMPDVDFMKSCIADAFEELKTAARGAMSAEERSMQTAEQGVKRDSAVA